jgi:hypothetical protein
VGVVVGYTLGVVPDEPTSGGVASLEFVDSGTVPFGLLSVGTLAAGFDSPSVSRSDSSGGSTDRDCMCVVVGVGGGVPEVFFGPFHQSIMQ